MSLMVSQITSLTVVYSKKTSKLRVTDLCVGNSTGPVNSPHKGPVTRKMFPFDDVIMYGIQTTESILHVTCYGLNALIHLPIGQQPYSLYRNAMSAKRQKVTSVWALFLVTVLLELLLILWHTSSCLNIWHRGLLVRSILLSVMLMWGTIIQLPSITLDGWGSICYVTNSSLVFIQGLYLMISRWRWRHA